MEKNKGFTLLEILIVVAMVAILSAVAVASYSSYTIRSACDLGKTSLASVDSFMNQLYLKYGVYNSADATATNFEKALDRGAMYFDINVDTTATTYKITLTPNNTGPLKGKSGTLIINNQGDKQGTGDFINVWNDGCSAIL